MRAPVWFRWASVLLGVPQLATGAWASFAPRHWYDTFPGFGPMLVAAEPPYNAHLAADAGAGFLATGLLLLVAAGLGRWPELRLALGGYLAFAVAHLAFHAAHPADRLTTAENAWSIGLVALSTAIPAFLLWVARPKERTP